MSYYPTNGLKNNNKKQNANKNNKNIANIIDATKNGHLRIFCSAIDTIITAIGKAKNNSNKFILFLPSLVPFVYYKMKIIIPIL